MLSLLITILLLQNILDCWQNQTKLPQKCGLLIYGERGEWGEITIVECARSKTSMLQGA